MSRRSRRQLFTFLYQVVTIIAATTFAFLLRFDFSLPVERRDLWMQALLVAVPLKLVILYLMPAMGLSWRFVGIGDVPRIALSELVASAGFATAMVVSVGSTFPRSILALDFMISFLIHAGGRLAIRISLERMGRRVAKQPNQKAVFIYGAASDGIRLAREIQSNPNLGYEVLGFLDDDPSKWETSVLGIPVLGRGRDAVHLVDKYKHRRVPVDEIIIAMSGCAGRQMQEVLANCRAAGVACKRLPRMSDMLAGKVLADQLRDISVEDLLGRPPVQLDEQGLRQSLSNRTVMVTGGAGSIGSELCRQIARCGPKNLIVLDQAESDLFRIDNELREKFPSVKITAVIGSIRDAMRIEDTIRAHGAEAIFHAAAYKHVPLMESSVLEAAQNNVIGTWNVLQAARRQGVSKFVMISSDKAVNPTSIMGLTKRIAELMVSAVYHDCRSFGGCYLSVRFGNVLGSNGSVVPLFQSRILKGGPVTVTHPEVKRYFMTIPEAVQLVLQASTMGSGAEIFVLDMGEPVRIVDLARTMIRLAGKIPDEEVEIRFVGLRPGEKIMEEINLITEDMTATSHEKIKIFKGAGVSRAELENWLAQLEDLISRRDASTIVNHFMALVPEYTPVKLPPASVNESPRRRAVAASSQSVIQSA